MNPDILPEDKLLYTVRPAKEIDTWTNFERRGCWID